MDLGEPLSEGESKKSGDNSDWKVVLSSKFIV